MTSRTAVIDVGSNTVHLLVADCDARTVRSVFDESVDSGLAAAIAAGTAIDADVASTAIEAVRRLATVAREQGASNVLVVGTHAVRAGQPALAEALEAAAGARLHIISPEAEADLCLAGASLDDLPPPPYLFADIGGGSTDLALVTAEGTAWCNSIDAGSGVLGIRHLQHDPPSPADIEAADAHVASALAALGPDSFDPAGRAVLTGGAARRLCRQTALSSRWCPATNTDALLEAIDLVLTTRASKWPSPPSDVRRAAVTRGGAVIVRAILHRWNISSYQISRYGIREGVLRRQVQGELPAGMLS